MYKYLSCIFLVVMLIVCFGTLTGCFDPKKQEPINIRADVAKYNPAVTISSISYTGQGKADNGDITDQYLVVEVMSHNGAQTTVNMTYAMDAKTAAVVSRKMESMH